VGALEEYLNDPNFEQNRIEYKSNKDAADKNLKNGRSVLKRGENCKHLSLNHLKAECLYNAGHVSFIHPGSDSDSSPGLYFEGDAKS
jgi:hypothetical protein